MGTITIGDSCEVLNGYAFKSEKYTSSGIRVIRIANVQKGYIEDDSPVFYQTDDVDLNKYMLRENDLLVSLTGNVGRTALLTKDMLPAALNQRVACLRLKTNKITRGFLFHLLNSDYFESKCIQSSQGVAQKNLSTEWLKSYDLPLYSLSKQNEITKILDNVRNTIILKEQEIQKYDELIKARFIEMFGDLRTNNKNWQVVSFNECASIDTNMIRDFDGYEDYPHIGIDSIEKDTGRIFGYRTISEDGVISGKYLFTPKHIIYSKIRPNLNKVALPDFIGLCSADAYPILVKDTVCTREYFGYTLRSRIFLDYILAFSSRTNLPKVNKSQVEGFKLPLPPIELQNQFADFVRHVDKSRFNIKKSIIELEREVVYD
jgi:type I restriction enzyme S subunit